MGGEDAETDSCSPVLRPWKSCLEIRARKALALGLVFGKSLLWTSSGVRISKGLWEVPAWSLRPTHPPFLLHQALGALNSESLPR